jgi:hypothetical protein
VSAAIRIGNAERTVPRADAPAWAIGAAGLGYVVAAGVENMELLRAPLRGAPAGEVRAAYADHALVTATALAGVLSLALYAVWATLLAPRLRWPHAALLGGLAGPTLALAGIAAAAPLVADAGAGMTDAAARAAFDLQQSLRLAAGPLMALVLVCAGASHVLPRRLARSAYAVAVPLALTPAAALADGGWPQVAAIVAFGAHSLWIWLASLWLAVGRSGSAADRVRRAAFLMLVVAAGLVGAALLIAPGATGAFFSWRLAPESLAAFAGGVYVGSAALYATGIRVPWRQARALVAAAVVLSVSVFAFTLVHLELFDLDRLQAWAWLVLFAGFAAVTGGLLVAGGPAGHGTGPAAARWSRALLAFAAVALAAVGAKLWIDPAGLPPLGGRFAGSWTAMLAVVAAAGALARQRDELRLPGLALILLPAGALCAAARTMHGDALYLTGLAALLACGAAVLATSRR